MNKTHSVSLMFQFVQCTFTSYSLSVSSLMAGRYAYFTGDWLVRLFDQWSQFYWRGILCR